LIAKQAIDEFLNAPVEDWAWLKGVPKEELLENIKEIYPDFDPKHIEPYKHQLASLLIGMSQKEFLFFLSMGLGKTIILLFLIAYLKYRGKLKSALVVVPNVSVVNSWSVQIKELSDLKVVELTGTMVERSELIKQEADLFIINYTGMQLLLTDIKEVKKYGKPAKNKWVPSPKKIKELSSKFNVVVFDEVHYVKDRNSLNFKLANKLTDVCEYRYGLTGTPFGRSPEDLWSQFYLIDKGKTLGTSLGLFREAFFTAKNNYWGGIDYKFKKELEPVLQKKLRNKSIRYSKEETEIELPPLIYNKVITTFSVEAANYYKAVVAKFINLKGNVEEFKNSFIKFRQITAGFLKHKTDEGEDILIRFAENPKLEALENLITSAPPDAKMIIFNEFIESGHIIEELLKKLKLKYIRLYSGTADKEKRNAETLFNEKSCRVALMNSQSGSLGLNMQAASYTFFYETPVSPITRSQAEMRTNRPGQKNVTFIYDIIMQKSVDEKILGLLKEGKDLSTALLDYQKEVKECST
jgi:SNF2 family DNA or RNA helicase